MTLGLGRLAERAIRDSLGHADSFPAGSRPGGLFRQDMAVIAAAPQEVRDVRDRLHATGISAAEMLLAHARDHILALARDVKRDPAPIWSPLTLCRAVQESTAWICHLLDPIISTEARLCRIAAHWLDDSQPARTAAGTFSAEDAADVAEYHEFKLSELAVGGFTVDAGGRHGILRVRLGQESAELDFKLSDAITRMLPKGMPSPYRLGSGAAHARPWMLERSVTRGPDGELVGEGTTTMAAAATVMFCMGAWVTTWGGYFGIDVNDQVTAIDNVRRSFIREGVTM